MTELDFAFDLDRLDTLSADDAASLLFVMRDAGLDDDDGVLEAWLGSSEEHQSAWARLTGIWDGFADDPDPLLDAMRRDALMARPARRPAWQRMSIATSVAAMLVAGVVGYQQIGWHPATPPAQIASANPAWSNGMGPPVIRTFADGTVVTLAPQSAIEVDYSAALRQMRLLRGRAFFAVAHQSNRPFEVLAEGRSITDIGTAFEVASSQGALAVTVSIGRVAVRAPAEKPVEIGAGESFTALPDTAPVVAKLGADDAAPWRDGYLDFHDTRLDVAISEAEAYGGPKLRVDPAIGGIRVSGRFRWGDTTRLARVLAQMYPVELVTASDGTLLLRSQS